MSTTKERYVHPKRKFHDAWAFILFVIVTISCNVFYIMQQPRKQLLVIEMNNLVYITIAYIFGCMAIQTLLFISMPAFLMHAAFFISPLLSLGMAVWSGNAIGIGIAAFWALISMMMYLYYRKHIKYSASVLRSSAKSITSYLYVVAPVVILSGLTLFAQTLVFAMKTDEDIQKTYLLYVALVFQMFWLSFTVLYFGRVFVSSIVALDLITVEQGTSIVGETFSNTLYCLGSICFASLIIAAVSTLKFFHDKSRRDSRDSGLGYVIIQAIIGILISLLKSIIEFMNDWALIYMSLYGTKYTQSVKESFDAIMYQRNFILTNNLCIVPVMNLLSFTVSLGYSFIVYVYLKNQPINEGIATLAILTMILMFVFNDIYVSMFDVGTKSFLFAYHKDPVAVKNKFPETYYLLEEQKYK